MAPATSKKVTASKKPGKKPTPKKPTPKTQKKVTKAPIKPKKSRTTIEDSDDEEPTSRGGTLPADGDTVMEEVGTGKEESKEPKKTARKSRAVRVEDSDDEEPTSRGRTLPADGDTIMEEEVEQVIEVSDDEDEDSELSMLGSEKCFIN